jgi:hypothetical protein
MPTKEKIEVLSPLAYRWAKSQEEFILKFGVPLARRQLADAQLAGVQDPARVRVLVVDRIPLPENQELAEAARRAQIITAASRVVTVGHGIIIRADSWRDRETLLHGLVHVAQCERSGGLESFVKAYIADRASCADFSVGSLEDEARQLAQRICAAPAVAR